MTKQAGQLSDAFSAPPLPATDPIGTVHKVFTTWTVHQNSTTSFGPATSVGPGLVLPSADPIGFVHKVFVGASVPPVPKLGQLWPRNLSLGGGLGMDSSAEHFKGVYSPMAQYNVNDIVFRAGTYWIATAPVVAGAAPSALTYVGHCSYVNTGYSSASVSTTIALPSGTKAGDLVVIGLLVQPHTNNVLPTMTPWHTTYIQSLNGSNGGGYGTCLAVGTYVVTSVDVSNGSIAVYYPNTAALGNGVVAYNCHVIRGGVVDQFTAATGLTSTAFTPCGPNEMVVYFGTVNGSNSANTVLACSALSDVINNGYAGNANIASGYETIATPTSRTFSISSGTPYGDGGENIIAIGLTSAVLPAAFQQMTAPTPGWRS